MFETYFVKYEKFKIDGVATIKINLLNFMLLIEVSIVSRFNNKILNKELLNLEQKINIDQFKIVLIIKFISWKIFQLIC